MSRKDYFVFAVIVLILSGCTNPFDTRVYGYTGIAKSSDNEIEIWVNPCGNEINEVTILGKIEPLNESFSANAFYGSFTSTTRHREFFRLSTKENNPQWETKNVSFPTEPGIDIFIDAVALKKNSLALPTETTVGDINQLQPGQVIYGDDKRTSEQEFIAFCGKNKE